MLFLVPVDGVGAPQIPQFGIPGALYEEETEGADEWERDTLERRRDIEETWKRYRNGQERAYARKKYFRNISEKFTNYRIWED